jgi:hypothetical protein
VEPFKLGVAWCVHTHKSGESKDELCGAATIYRPTRAETVLDRFTIGEGEALTLYFRLRPPPAPLLAKGSRRVDAMSEDRGLRDRVVKEGEEAIGKLAQELLDNPVVSGALSAAFETRERAMRAQELAMGALNLPSASDLERLTRRLRSVSQRLEGIEDGLDRLEQRIEGLGNASGIEQRLAAIEEKLDALQAER